MKKKSFFCALLFALWQVNAQTLLDETFESTADPDPITSIGYLPSGWSTIDLNGDGLTWVGSPSNFSVFTDPMGFSGKTAVVPVDIASPNDALVSPVVSLPTGGNYTLNYQVGTDIGTPPPDLPPGIPYPYLPFDNLYAVYVLPEGQSLNVNNAPLFEEVISAGNIAFNKSIDISAFAGQNIRVYFRIYDSLNKGYILLDNIKINQNTLGISEIQKNKNFYLYPNPTADYLKIKSDTEVIKVSIVDLMGKKSNVDFSNNTIDVKNLSAGVYFITVETKNNTITEKFIKK